MCVSHSVEHSGQLMLVSHSGVGVDEFDYDSALAQLIKTNVCITVDLHSCTFVFDCSFVIMGLMFMFDFVLVTFPCLLCIMQLVVSILYIT